MKNLVQHLRNVFALMIREMNTRYGGRPGGYIWALVDPLAYMIIMTALRLSLNRVPPIGDSMALFIASGYIAYNFYQTTMSYVVAAVSGNKALLNYPAIAPIDTVIARFILQFGTNLMVAVFAVYLTRFDGADLPAVHIGIILEAVIAASAFGLALSLMNIPFFSMWPAYEKIYKAVTRPMLFLSGVFILPEELPDAVAKWLLWNPLVHITMWSRSGFFSEYHPAVMDKSYAVSACCVLMLIGLAAFTFNTKVLRSI